MVIYFFILIEPSSQTKPKSQLPSSSPTNSYQELQHDPQFESYDNLNDDSMILLQSNVQQIDIKKDEAEEEKQETEEAKESSNPSTFVLQDSTFDEEDMDENEDENENENEDDESIDFNNSTAKRQSFIPMIRFNENNQIIGGAEIQQALENIINNSNADDLFNKKSSVHRDKFIGKYLNALHILQNANSKNLTLKKLDNDNVIYKILSSGWLKNKLLLVCINELPLAIIPNGAKSFGSTSHIFLYTKIEKQLAEVYDYDSWVSKAANRLRKQIERQCAINIHRK